MENIIGLKDFRMNVEKYAKTAQKGVSVVVMRRSKPIFRISPVEEGNWEEVLDFTKMRKGGVNIEDLISRL
jgi:antitoxin (DNA-binding transcriptional repressor) of toxin-antitoxin stability system